MFQAFVSISAIPLSETLKNNRAIEVECVPSVREGPKLKVSESAGPKPTEIYVSKRETFAAEVPFIWGEDPSRLANMLFSFFFYYSRFTDSVPETG